MHWLVPCSICLVEELELVHWVPLPDGGDFGGLGSAQKSWAVCQRDDGRSMEIVLEEPMGWLPDCRPFLASLAPFFPAGVDIQLSVALRAPPALIHGVGMFQCSSLFTGALSHY